MSEVKQPSFKAKIGGHLHNAVKQLDKALDAGVQSALVTIFNTPPEMPVDWRSMLRFGGRFLSETAKETIAAIGKQLKRDE